MSKRGGAVTAKCWPEANIIQMILEIILKLSLVIYYIRKIFSKLVLISPRHWVVCNSSLINIEVLLNKSWYYSYMSVTSSSHSFVIKISIGKFSHFKSWDSSLQFENPIRCNPNEKLFTHTGYARNIFGNISMKYLKDLMLINCVCNP